MAGGTNLPLVRDYNEGVVLEAIRVGNGSSRVEVAQGTGLAPQTVSNIVRRLLEAGLIEEAGKAESSGGKPRVRLKIKADARFAVGVQIDGWDTSFVVIDLLGQVVERARQPTRQEQGSQDLLRRIAQTATRLLERAGISTERVLGLGVACPGPLDHRQGVVFDPPNLKEWHNVAVGDILAKETGFPVVVDNDATAAAIGERWSGGAHDVRNFAFVYMGVGIGAGIFVEDHVYRGSTTNAGELGHITLDPDGPPCFCGGKGCIEALCAPAAIEASARKHLSAGEHSVLTPRFEESPDGVGFDIISEAALRGDPVATNVMMESARLLGYGVVNLVNLLDLELIVLGGRAFRDVGELYRVEVERLLQEREMRGNRRDTRVELSVAGQDAGAVGAASLVLHAEYAPRLAGLGAA